MTPPKLRPVQGPSEGTHAKAPENIRLTADRILVRVPDESERRSKGGLVIPATAANPIRRCVWSEVVLTGPEVRSVRPGHRVLFIPHAALEVEVEGETFLLLRERDVQAIASEERADGHSGQYL